MSATELAPTVSGKPMKSVELSELVGNLFEPLSATANETCDGHASGGTAALVMMILPSGKLLALCGNCARTAGYEHTEHDHGLVQNRLKGSDH